MQSICVTDCAHAPPAPLPSPPSVDFLPGWLGTAAAVLLVLFILGAMGYAFATLGTVRHWIQRRLGR